MIKLPSSLLNTDSLVTQNQTLPDPQFKDLIIADGSAADIRQFLHGSPLPAVVLDGISEPLSVIQAALPASQLFEPGQLKVIALVAAVFAIAVLGFLFQLTMDDSESPAEMPGSQPNVTSSLESESVREAAQ
jgi:hypothetical protein